MDMHYGVVDEQIDKDGWTYGESDRPLSWSISQGRKCSGDDTH